MVRIELPKTINLDSQLNLGKSFSDIFPDGNSSHLANFRGALALGYKEDSHRKVTKTLSMAHGNILYGTKQSDKFATCALPARIFFSTDRRALELLGKTDHFLTRYRDYIFSGTARYMQHSPRMPYKKQNQIIAIPPESGLFKDKPLSRETVYACLYLPDKAILRKSPIYDNGRLKTAPSTKPSMSGYDLQYAVSSIFMYTTTRNALYDVINLNDIDISNYSDNTGSQQNLSLVAGEQHSFHTTDTNAHIHNRDGMFIDGCAYRDVGLFYGIKRYDDKKEPPISLFFRPVRFFFSDDPAALDHLPQSTGWQNNWKTSNSQQPDIDEQELTLVPVAKTTQMGRQNLYVRAFATNGVIRTKNQVPKLDVAVAQDEEKKLSLTKALSNHLGLPSKYKKLHISLEESKLTENVSLLSGGRSGTIICHFNASLDKKSLEKLMTLYKWNPDFKEVLEEKGISFVTRIASTPKQKAMLDQHTLVQKKLWEAGFPVPKTDETGVIPYYAEDTGQYICTEAYMRGRRSDKLEPVHLSALGESLGRLHASGIKLPIPKVRNVLDEDVLFNDAIWTLDNIEKIACPDGDERSDWQPSHSEIYDSIVKELFNRFATNDKNLPAWAYINIKQPTLAKRLRDVGKEISQRSQQAHLQKQDAFSSVFKDLPHSSSCWNDAHLGNLILHDDGITMLDFGNSGEGIPALDLELSSFSACVDEEGKLTPERTLPFFLSYIFARNQAAEEKGTLPVTQEEIMALPKLLTESSRGRELAIIAMYKDKFEENKDDPKKLKDTQKEYYGFIRRIKGLRKQMSQFMDDKGIVTPDDADRFAQTFFGMSLAQFPVYSDLKPSSPTPKHDIPDWLITPHKPTYSGLNQPMRKSLLPFLDSEQFQKTELVILDLWGIINNDTGYYPSAIKTVKELRAAGKKIVFLSNSPVMGSIIQQRLKGFGLEIASENTKGDYDAVITSGDMMYEHFAGINASLAEKNETKKYLLIGNKESSRQLLSDLNQYIATTNPEEADFILCTSAPNNRKNPADDEELNELLQKCASREPPLLFYDANPDIQCSDSSRERIYCGGSVAKKYAEIIGEKHIETTEGRYIEIKGDDAIITYGKPAGKIYDKAIEAAGLQQVPDYQERVVAIGDSLLTDIKGARNAGFHSILIRNEGHYHEMPEAGSIRATDEKSMRGQCKHLGIFPDLIAHSFSFSEEQAVGVIPDYDKAIVNVGGVLKDDQGFFDDAITGIRALRQHGKDVLIVSNTPYRSSYLEKILREKQLYPEKDFVGILTAGDMAYKHFAAEDNPNIPKYYCLISGEEDSAQLLDPLKGYICLNPNAKEVTLRQLQMADFVLCTSAPDKTRAPQDYFQANLEMIAEECQTRKDQGKDALMFYDVNSDLQTPQRDQSTVHCGGEIAELLKTEYKYPQENVIHFGKPSAPFYQEAIRILSNENNIHPERIVSFDDSIRNITGAHQANIISAKVGNRDYHTAESGLLSPIEGIELTISGNALLPAAPTAADFFIPEFAMNTILPPAEQKTLRTAATGRC